MAHERDTDQGEGGVNLHAFKNTERLICGYHYRCRSNAPQQWTYRIILIKSLFPPSTGHDLEKMPYLRESRRSIGS